MASVSIRKSTCLPATERVTQGSAILMLWSEVGFEARVCPSIRLKQSQKIHGYWGRWLGWGAHWFWKASVVPCLEERVLPLSASLRFIERAWSGEPTSWGIFYSSDPELVVDEVRLSFWRRVWSWCHLVWAARVTLSLKSSFYGGSHHLENFILGPAAGLIPSFSLSSPHLSYWRPWRLGRKVLLVVFGVYVKYQGPTGRWSVLLRWFVAPLCQELS